MKYLKILPMAILTILCISVLGQDTTKQKVKPAKQKTEKTIFKCPMHPEVTSDKPGKCSKCGMNLKETVIEETVYSCPMKCEGDKTYDKPGKCSVCGMNLKGSPKEKMKMEVMKIYSCPMHPDVTSDKPGKCSKCGMNLQEKKN